MADSKTKKLTHVNGATVVVPAEKAERLVAAGNFSETSSRRSTSSDK